MYTRYLKATTKITCQRVATNKPKDKKWNKKKSPNPKNGRKEEKGEREKNWTKKIKCKE